MHALGDGQGEIRRPPVVERGARKLLAGEELVHRPGGRLACPGHHALGRLGQKLVGLHLADHLEGRIEPHLQRVLAQDAGGHAVDGGHPGVVHLQRLGLKPLGQKEPLDAPLQLGGGFGGEGDGQKLVHRREAGPSRLGRKGEGHPLGEGEGLAGARAGRHHERRVERRHHGALAFGAAIEIHASLLSQPTAGQ